MKKRQINTSAIMATLVFLTLGAPASAERRSERAISHLDQNGDELVSIDEFQLPERMHRAGPQGPKHFFDQADANGDGAVTRDEMNAHRKEMKEKHEARQEASMDEAFTRMDTDGDGAITSEEIRIAAFTRLDGNQDGYLSADELKRHRGGKPMHGKRHARHDLDHVE